jgi:hypothetical protein
MQDVFDVLEWDLNRFDEEMISIYPVQMLPREAVPYGPIDDFIISLNSIRKRVHEN